LYIYIEDVFSGCFIQFTVNKSLITSQVLEDHYRTKQYNNNYCSRVEPFSETEKCKLKMIEEVSLMRKGHLEVTEFGYLTMTMFAQNSAVEGWLGLGVSIFICSLQDCITTN
jgi:hypothetical protein